MPAFRTRVGEYESLRDPVHTQIGAVPFTAPTTQLSPPGNPAPYRGLLPPEYTTEAEVRQYLPFSPMLRQGLIDLNGHIRNLALQAFVQAGGKVV